MLKVLAPSVPPVAGESNKRRIAWAIASTRSTRMLCSPRSLCTVRRASCLVLKYLVLNTIVRPLGRGWGAGDLVFDAAVALGVATDDSEVALLAPVRVPRVGDLPVLGARVDAPSNELDSVAAGHLARGVGVDPAGVVLKVRVHGEGGLDWAAFHDHLLDHRFAGGRLGSARERELVGSELFVRGSIALLWALWRGLRRATWGTFSWVRVGTLWAVVVAVWEGEVGALVLAERSAALVLSARDGAFLGNVVPWGVDLATVATIVVGAKADVLGRDWSHQGTLGGDAHTVGGSLGACKGPTAAAVGLVTDVVDHLGAGWEGSGRVKGVWDWCVGSPGWDEGLHSACRCVCNSGVVTSANDGVAYNER